MKSEYLNIILSLAGGIGIFLLGMKFLSDGLQTVAGDKLKMLIGMATNNRIFGVGIGFLVTAIIQSSSVTTVLVVSFVDGGLMTLAQAVGVIMGANIGTTITGWILTIKIDEYGLPLAGIAAIVYIFAKKDTVKYVALGMLGLGCVFLGLLFMKNAMAPVKNYPEFVAMFKTFQATSYLGVLKCALVGCLMTLIAQSSSVTIGITMVLASQGLIGFETAAALVLGENVGTTITAVLASLATKNNNARRAAYFHALFNLTGVFYITLLFQPFLKIVEWELGTFFGITDLNNFANISFGIAAVHSTFNIFNCLIFLAPCRIIAKFLEKYVLKGKQTQATEIEDMLKITSFRDASYMKFVDTEARIQKVLVYMGNQLKEGFENLNYSIENPDKKSQQVQQIFGMEDNCDKIKTSVQTALMGFTGSEETLNSAVQYRIFAYERIFDNLESVSDYMTQIAKLRLRLIDNKVDFTPYQKEDLQKLNGMIFSAFDKLLPSFEHGLANNPALMENHEQDFSQIREFIREMRTNLWSHSKGVTTEPIVDDAYSNMLYSYRKIRDHLRSTGNAIFGIDKD